MYNYFNDSGKHKVFVSYYHKDDQKYKNYIDNNFKDIMINKSVMDNDIDSDNSDEYIKRLYFRFFCSGCFSRKKYKNKKTHRLGNICRT